jgi:hypothetical protein
MTGAGPDRAVALPGGRTLAAGRGPRQTATLALLAFAMLVVSLDQYIVVVALPTSDATSAIRLTRCSR